jgi:cytochrome c
MNLEINKMAGALLGSLLLVMGIGQLSSTLYSRPEMTRPGYELPGPKEESKGPATAAPTAPAVPLPVLLAAADAKTGAASAKPCTTCHSFDKGGPAKIGPPLYGVVGRTKGSIPGFAYSDAMKAKGGDWSYADIDEMITNPKAFVAGTKMAFAGEKDAAKRADIIAYLRSLADSPLPLPAK